MQINEKRILFIFPNTSNVAWISSAIPILAGIAKKNNFKTSYFDTYNYRKSLSTDDEKEIQGGFKAGYKLIFREQLPYENIAADLQRAIDCLMPDIVAVTALSEEYEFFMSFWGGIRTPEKTKVIIGGIHSILSPEKISESLRFDLVCTGQAESIFPEILSRVNRDESLDAIAGTFYLNRSTNEIKKYPSPGLLPSDRLWNTEPDFSLLDDNYFLRPFDGRTIRRYEIELGRGCPYKCNYCGNSALKNALLKPDEPVSNFLTRRPLDSAFAHFNKMIREYRIDIFQFTDECFLAHPAGWLDEFMRRYAKEVARPFIFQTRAETVSEEKIALMQKHGIPFQVSLGVESGADHILSEICNRKCTSGQIVSAFDILHAHKIRTNAYFMIGFPYETRQDFFKTVRLYRRIKPSVSSVSIFQPLPGQELTKLCIEKGFITGREPMATFTSHSILNMPSPYLSAKEIKNLWRVFVLYSTLPEEYYPDIQKCESDYDNNKDLFEKLVQLRWEHDYAKERRDISLLNF